MSQLRNQQIVFVPTQAKMSLSRGGSIVVNCTRQPCPKAENPQLEGCKSASGTQQNNNSIPRWVNQVSTQHLTKMARSENIRTDAYSYNISGAKHLANDSCSSKKCINNKTSQSIQNVKSQLQTHLEEKMPSVIEKASSKAFVSTGAVQNLQFTSQAPANRLGKAVNTKGRLRKAKSKRGRKRKSRWTNCLKIKGLSTNDGRTTDSAPLSQSLDQKEMSAVQNTKPKRLGSLLPDSHNGAKKSRNPKLRPRRRIRNKSRAFKRVTKNIPGPSSVIEVCLNPRKRQIKPSRCKSQPSVAICKSNSHTKAAMSFGRKIARLIDREPHLKILRRTNKRRAQRVKTARPVQHKPANSLSDSQTTQLTQESKSNTEKKVETPQRIEEASYMKSLRENAVFLKPLQLTKVHSVNDIHQRALKSPSVIGCRIGVSADSQSLPETRQSSALLAYTHTVAAKLTQRASKSFPRGKDNVPKEAEKKETKNVAEDKYRSSQTETAAPKIATRTESSDPHFNQTENKNDQFKKNLKKMGKKGSLPKKEVSSTQPRSSTNKNTSSKPHSPVFPGRSMHKLPLGASSVDSVKCASKRGTQQEVKKRPVSSDVCINSPLESQGLRNSPNLVNTQRRFTGRSFHRVGASDSSAVPTSHQVDERISCKNSGIVKDVGEASSIQKLDNNLKYLSNTDRDKLSKDSKCERFPKRTALASRHATTLPEGGTTVSNHQLRSRSTLEQAPIACPSFAKVNVGFTMTRSRSNAFLRNMRASVGKKENKTRTRSNLSQKIKMNQLGDTTAEQNVANCFENRQKTVISGGLITREEKNFNMNSNPHLLKDGIGEQLSHRANSSRARDGRTRYSTKNRSANKQDASDPDLAVSQVGENETASDHPARKNDDDGAESVRSSPTAENHGATRTDQEDGLQATKGAKSTSSVKISNSRESQKKKKKKRMVAASEKSREKEESSLQVTTKSSKSKSNVQPGFPGWDDGKELAPHTMTQLPSFADKAAILLANAAKQKLREQSVMADTADHAGVCPHNCHEHPKVYLARKEIQEMFTNTTGIMLNQLPQRPMEVIVDLAHEMDRIAGCEADIIEKFPFLQYSQSRESLDNAGGPPADVATPRSSATADADSGGGSRRGSLVPDNTGGQVFYHRQGSWHRTDSSGLSDDPS